MASAYPGAVDTFTTKEDKVDLYEAAHINDIQNAVVATQTELGTDVAGSATDLKTRLARCISDDGSMNQGTSFPASPNEGDFFYRTDLNVMYIYNGSDWDPMGVSLSNCIMYWQGSDSEHYSAGLVDLYSGTSLSNSSYSGPKYLYYFGDSNSPQTIKSCKYVHLGGITTLTLHARLWCGANTARLTCDVGGGTVTGYVETTSTSPTWVTVATLDVSGLTPGTVYTVLFQLSNTTNEQLAYCSTIQLIAS